MTLSNNVTIKTRGGLKSKLPTAAPERELIVTTDTAELFVGTGTGIKQIGGGAPKHVTNRVLYDDTHAAYADGVKGGLDPKGREGWYFTNSVIGSKINWYYYDQTQMNTTVSDFKGTYAVITLDTNKIPFFVVYTAGTDFVWYKSVRVYYISNPASVVPGKYLIYTGSNPSVYPELPRIQLTTDVSNPLNKGAFGASETISYLAMHTDSTTVNYQFVAHNLGVLTTAENYELQLKTKADTTKVVQIPAALSTWTILHNMGKRPAVTVIDTSGNVITGQVVYNSDQQITIYFTPAVAGTVYLN